MTPMFGDIRTMFRFSAWVRPAAALTTTAAMIALAACADTALTPPAAVLPTDPAIPAQYRAAAFIFDVSATKKTVSITAPSATNISPIAAASLNLGVSTGWSYSVLGGDVIGLSTSNYQASAVGAFIPGKLRITFDVSINNRLAGIRLVTPTFPTPPAGVTGVQAFPFQMSVTSTAGSVEKGTANNEAVITPSLGLVVPSSNWDGNPHNFFNDAGCPVTATDCFRYESFGEIGPLASSTMQQIGFDVDPTVAIFRVKVLVVADLENNVGGPPPGGVSGTVTTPAGVSLAGAIVNVSGGFSGTVGANGAYTVANVGTGSRTVFVTNLPSYCVAPASQNITALSGANVTANFIVSCTIPTAPFAGTVTSSLGGDLRQVRFTPRGYGVRITMIGPRRTWDPSGVRGARGSASGTGT
jgi:hypothetical protein